MKKVIAVVVMVVAILAIMFAVAKFAFDPKETEDISTTETTAESTLPETSTEAESESQTILVLNPIEDDTKPSVTIPSTTKPTTKPTTEPTTKPTTQPTTQPTTESTTQPTTKPTTTEPTTQQSAGSAELLNKYVLSAINSGSYTMSISAFGEDKSPDDKLVKTVNGGKTAFRFSIPAAKMSFTVFPSEGKYYLATDIKYCEMTKAQYDNICATFNRGMYNFGGLSYQKTESVRDGFSVYTCEHFKTSDGKDCVLWYNGNQLSKLELKMDGVSHSLPMTVSSSVNTDYFVLNEGLEQVDYETLKSYVDLAGLFF